ncbi:MAG: hypothetical protein ACR2JB_20840 [Bryobacteraceae bacterium]
MPRSQTNERPTLRLVANPERVQEGARQILESSVENFTESFVESASFEDLTTWDAILTFWNESPDDGLMGAISKVAYADDAR